MSEKVCLECDNPFNGRADKKFCSDMCRNAFNNKIAGDFNNTSRSINAILRKNRMILKEINVSGKAKASKQQMLDAGFNFNYLTNYYKTKSGKTYIFCYDQGYLPIENNYYALVVKQEYIR